MKTWEVTYHETSARQWTRTVKANDRDKAIEKGNAMIDGEHCDGEASILESEWEVHSYD